MCWFFVDREEEVSGYVALWCNLVAFLGPFGYQLVLLGLSLFLFWLSLALLLSLYPFVLTPLGFHLACFGFLWAPFGLPLASLVTSFESICWFVNFLICQFGDLSICWFVNFCFKIDPTTLKIISFTSVILMIRTKKEVSKYITFWCNLVAVLGPFGLHLLLFRLSGFAFWLSLALLLFL